MTRFFAIKKSGLADALSNETVARSSFQRTLQEEIVARRATYSALDILEKQVPGPQAYIFVSERAETEPHEGSFFRL